MNNRVSESAESTVLPDLTQGHLAAEAEELDLAPDEMDQSPKPMFLSGIQALAHLLILQRLRDVDAGLNTAGFVSGYRGSPVGNVDQALWKIKKRLEEHHIRFEPGINEDLAATMVWGTQQVNLYPDANYDGVFAMWYGKGPGVDRTMDVFKHANSAGTSPKGGVLLIAGDDHGAKSSSIAHQSEHMLAGAMIPVLNPSGVQEYLDYGIHGWAMSRYSSCWVGMKATADTIESSATVIVDHKRVKVRIPQDFHFPEGGLGIRWPDPPLEQEFRLQRYKVYAALAYARLNQLNRVVIDSPSARLGIITAGKSYLDVRQALAALGIDEAAAAQIGIRVYKLGMSWPLDAEGVRAFATGLEEILVVEEKRQLIEYQVKEQLYNWRDDVRPRVIGKFDEDGEWQHPLGDWQLPASGELTPGMIARVIASRVARFHQSERIDQYLAVLKAKDGADKSPVGITRIPHYCSGCPHNTSTMNLPEGSRVLAGIGCHYMSVWLNPTTTKLASHMGGEGVLWAGQAPFVKTPHSFANVGDGTYQHSGLMAIRQAVAAKAPITYKILFNDAVAMTGGQPVEGSLTVPMITQQVAGEGVQKIVIVTDDPQKYKQISGVSPNVPVRPREDLDAVQRELREYRGVSALIYDQTCAAEKRRRRKKGEYPDPPVRAFINDRVCEGCGDCSAQSNCMSVIPIDTEFGRKRLIDQSSCNKDFSCVKGFCPSFVTVHGGKLRKGRGVAGDVEFALPEPQLPSLAEPYGILVTGVGGTGVVTIGVLLGIAANIESKGITVLDMAGLAQKGGPVSSHLRIAAKPEDLYATRLSTAEAHAIIGCDIVVAAAEDALDKMRKGVTRAAINSDFSVTSDFVRAFSAQASTGDLRRNPDPQFPLRTMERKIEDAVGKGRVDYFPATRLATALMGDSIATNPFMLGYAYQKGMLPVSGQSLLKAIEQHGVAVKANTTAFIWGRRAAHDLAAVERVVAKGNAAAATASHRASVSLDEMISRRVLELTRYQDAAYASRYTALVDKVKAAERARGLPGDALTGAVARGYYKLLAYKDEYEVARLYSDVEYLNALKATFEGDFKLEFHLAPPLLSKPDPVTGEARKRAYGSWMLSAFRVLAKLKGLRGSAFDPFGYSEDRKVERRLIAEYERILEEIVANLDHHNYDAAVELASLPDAIRGYGHVKNRHIKHAKVRESELLEKFRARQEPSPKAATSKVHPIVIMAG